LLQRIMPVPLLQRTIAAVRHACTTTERRDSQAGGANSSAQKK